MCVCECILVLKKTYLSNISVHKQLFCILSTVSCIKRRKTLFITLKIYCQCYFFKKYIHYTFILKIPVNNRNHVKRGFCEGRKANHSNFSSQPHSSPFIRLNHLKIVVLPIEMLICKTLFMEHHNFLQKFKNCFGKI